MDPDKCPVCEKFLVDLEDPEPKVKYQSKDICHCYTVDYIDAVRELKKQRNAVGKLGIDYAIKKSKEELALLERLSELESENRKIRGMHTTTVVHSAEAWQNDELKKQLQDVLNNLDDTRTELTDEIHRLQDRVRDRDATIAGLEGEIKDREEAWKTLAQDRDIAVDEIRRLRTKLDSAETMVANNQGELRTKNKKLKAQVKELKEQVKGLKRRVKDDWEDLVLIRDEHIANLQDLCRRAADIVGPRAPTLTAELREAAGENPGVVYTPSGMLPHDPDEELDPRSEEWWKKQDELHESMNESTTQEWNERYRLQLNRKDEHIHNLRNKYEEANRMLLDLLATIHRDGGHYTDLHGLKRSFSDALEIWSQYRRDLDQLETCGPLCPHDNYEKLGDKWVCMSCSMMAKDHQEIYAQRMRSSSFNKEAKIRYFLDEVLTHDYLKKNLDQATTIWDSLPKLRKIARAALQEGDRE